MNLLNTLNLALQSLIAISKAYIRNSDREDERDIEKIEDEIDRIAANGSPADKLRLPSLGQRLERKRKRTL